MIYISLFQPPYQKGHFAVLTTPMTMMSCKPLLTVMDVKDRIKVDCY